MPAAKPNRRRWAIVVVIALAQLMVALDATIVTIALPTVQHTLGIATADRQWVITAYTVAFGGLVLLGGRLADWAGRKRVFLGGLLGFAAASAVGGAAVTPAMLICARVAQGASAAVLAPTALSLLTVTFTEDRQRARAFAVYGTVAASGGACGLILGGLLTESLTWRWCLYVNVPIALVAGAASWRVLHPPEPDGRPPQDIPGALLVTGGVIAAVYGCTQAATAGWTSTQVVSSFVVTTVLLIGFAVRESRVATAILPPRLLAERNRAGAYLAMGVAVAGMLAMFLSLTYYMQVVLDYSPVQTGLAFLPLSGAVLLSANVFAARAVPHVRPRALIGPGLLLVATGMVILSQLTTSSDYTSHVLPAELILGAGLGCVFVPAISAATRDVEPRDAGTAAAVVNAAQQFGGSLGTALVNTVAAAATATYLSTRPNNPMTATDGLVHGFTVATTWGAVVLTVAAAAVVALINTGQPSARAYR